MRCGADVSGEQSRVATSVAPARPAAAKLTATQAMQVDPLDALRDATLGDYEILAELGRGGMATVFLAHDLQLDRKVAIKVMSPQLVAGEGMVDRFKLEARTAAGLSHPHIIPIYAVRQTNGLLYFVMKFIEGRPLDSIIKQSAPLPVPMVRSIVTKVGEALGYAHRRGVIHRDIKPANIMIDIEGMPIVTDFGIAKVADKHGLTMTGATIGTPTYMSPEQCNAQPITGASDQYSLGVMAYEMLTGRPLYDGDSVMTIMFKHVHDAPPTAESLGPGVPRDLADAVARMLRKTPAERWPTIEDALPSVAGSNLAYDDSVRTQMVQFARAGAQRAILDRVSTPRSPIPAGALNEPIESAETVRVSSGVRSATRQKAAAKPAPRPEAVPRPKARAGLVAVVLAVVVLGAGGALLALKPWVRAPAASPAGSGTEADAAAPVENPEPQVTLPPARSPDTTPAAPPPAPAAAATPVAARVNITSSPSRLQVGDVFALQASVSDQDNRPMSRRVRWTSDNTAVARVSGDGRLEALSEGRAVISADADGKRQMVTVVVTAVPVVRVDVSPSGGTVDVGGRLTLTAAPIGSGGPLADRTVIWQSNNDEVATVSAAGEVTGVGPGDATITAASGGVSGSAQIRVRPRVDAAPPAAPANSTVTTPPAPAPQVAIAELVQSYAAALQSKVMARVRALYPDMTSQQVRATQDALEAMQGLRVQLTASDIQVTGSEASARVTGQWLYNRGERLNYNQVFEFELRPEGWRIVAIR
jgi:serine/threonine-protein kinase